MEQTDETFSPISKAIYEDKHGSPTKFTMSTIEAWTFNRQLVIDWYLLK